MQQKEKDFTEAKQIWLKEKQEIELEFNVEKAQLKQQISQT